MLFSFHLPLYISNREIGHFICATFKMVSHFCFLYSYSLLVWHLNNDAAPDNTGSLSWLNENY